MLKKSREIAVAVGLLVTVGLHASRQQAVSGSRTIRFWVHDGATPSRGVRGVYVALVTRSGTRTVGRTDTDGEIKLPIAATISSPGAESLLFCRDETGISCAAVRLDTGVMNGFEEFNVEMPGFRIIDRILVAPRP